MTKPLIVVRPHNAIPVDALNNLCEYLHSQVNDEYAVLVIPSHVEVYRPEEGQSIVRSEPLPQYIDFPRKKGFWDLVIELFDRKAKPTQEVSHG